MDEYLNELLNRFLSLNRRRTTQYYHDTRLKTASLVRLTLVKALRSHQVIPWQILRYGSLDRTHKA